MPRVNLGVEKTRGFFLFFVFPGPRRDRGRAERDAAITQSSSTGLISQQTELTCSLMGYLRLPVEIQ